MQNSFKVKELILQCGSLTCIDFDYGFKSLGPYYLHSQISLTLITETDTEVATAKAVLPVNVLFMACHE